MVRLVSPMPSVDTWVINNDYDPDTNDNLTIALGSLSPQFGSVEIQPNGRIRYRPLVDVPDGNTIVDSYSYTVTDSSGVQNLPIRDITAPMDILAGNIVKASGIDWIAAGFAIGDQIELSGFGNVANDGTYRILSIGSGATADEIIVDQPMAPESGATVNALITEATVTITIFPDTHPDNATVPFHDTPPAITIDVNENAAPRLVPLIGARVLDPDPGGLFVVDLEADPSSEDQGGVTYLPRQNALLINPNHYNYLAPGGSQQVIYRYEVSDTVGNTASPPNVITLRFEGAQDAPTGETDSARASNIEQEVNVLAGNILQVPGASWAALGFEDGDRITTSGFANPANNFIFTIVSVNAGTPDQMQVSGPLVAEVGATASVAEAILVDVLANDGPPEQLAFGFETLTVQASGLPINGVVQVAGTSIQYTPDPGFLGRDTFTYRINDGTSLSAPIQVTVVVGPIDLEADFGEDDLPPGTINLLEETTDLIALPLNADDFADASGNNQITNATILGENPLPTVTFIGPGSDSFRITLDEIDSNNLTLPTGTYTSRQQIVDAVQEVINNHPLFETVGILAQLENDRLRLISESTGANSSIEVLSGNVLGDLGLTVGQRGEGIEPGVTLNIATDELEVDQTRYTYLASGETETVTVAFNVIDVAGATSTRLVSVGVVGANDSPVAYDDTAETENNAHIDVNVQLNDVDPDQSDTLTTFLGDLAPKFGQVIVNPNGSIRYVPDPTLTTGFVDTFSYFISDGIDESQEAIVTVNGFTNNLPPVGMPDFSPDNELEYNQDDPVDVVSLIGGGFDPEGQVLTVEDFRIVAGDESGVGYNPRTFSMIIDPNAYRYLGDGQIARVDVAYTVTDNQGNRVNMTGVILFEGEDDDPIAVDDVVVTREDTPIIIAVLDNDIDVNETGEVTLVLPDPNAPVPPATLEPANGVITFTANNTITYTPDLNFFGTDIFKYVVEDDDTQSNVATVTVTVVPFNDPPVSFEDVTATFEVDEIAVSPDGDLPVESLLPYQVFEETVRLFGFDLVDPGPLHSFGDYNPAGSVQQVFDDRSAIPIPGVSTGYYNGDTVYAAERGLDNGFRGVFIDDFIIGFAERGEVALTSTQGFNNFVQNPDFEAIQYPSNGFIDEVDFGSYQAEIRLSSDYAASADTNIVHDRKVGIQFVDVNSGRPITGAEISDGSEIRLSDGVNEITLEFEDVTNPNVRTGINIGSVPIQYTVDMNSAQVASAFRDAVNSSVVQTALNIAASSSDGEINPGQGTSDLIILHGPAASDVYGRLDFSVDPARLPITVIQFGAERSFEETGDENRHREQGQVILQGNRVVDSGSYGIIVDAGQRSRFDVSQFASTVLPRPGTERRFITGNPDELVPGVIVMNNVLAGNGAGGVLVSGEEAGNDAPQPFARVINNTIYGDQSGIGIRVENSAAPTLLNNAVVNLATGIQVVGPVDALEIFGTIYADNNTNTQGVGGLGAFPLTPTNTNLFVNPAVRNFYPEDLSELIDSAVGSVDDREALKNLRLSLGIGESPILAPLRDITGQLRVDDPDVNTGSGTGPVVFVDRGAIDRSDNLGPIATLNDPLDNDTEDIDKDGFETYVRLVSGTQRQFIIQLDDVDGTGPDDLTVREEAVVVAENGQRLIPGVDYTFGYSATSNTIILTPASGVWNPESAYEITLNNRDRIVLGVPNGLGIVDGDQFTIVDEDLNQAVFEYDSGFVLQIAQTLAIDVVSDAAQFVDRETFSIVSPDGLTEIFFEFERIGGVTSPNVPVDISSAVTAEDVRDAMFAAISDPGIVAQLGIAPERVGTTRIQLGSQSGTVVNEFLIGLEVDGIDEGIVDGDIFLYSQGGGIVRQFEFDDSGLPDPFAVPGNLDPATTDFIRLDPTDTPEELADKIGDAVRNAPLGLTTARGLEDGRVLLGGNTGDTMDIFSGGLTLLGSAGVTGKLMLAVPAVETGATVDGQLVTVTHAGVSETFLLTTDSTVTTTDTIVLLLPTDDANVIAASLANEIATFFAGLLNSTATDNVIDLGEPDLVQSDGTLVNTLVDLSLSTLTSTGTGGGALPVPFIPSIEYTADTLAGQVIAAIGRSGLKTTAFAPGGGTVWLDNTDSIDAPDAGLVGAIRDLAGNELEPNRVNRETQFTILMPGVELDFGDAPSRLAGVNQYLTVFDENGARHTVTQSQTPRLGTYVDTEADAFPHPDADDVLSTITPTATGAFTVAQINAGEVVVGLTGGTPMADDLLTLDIDGNVRRYELILAGTTPLVGEVGIIFVPGEPTDVLAQRVADAVARDLDVEAVRTTVIYENGSVSFTVRSVDDEDGLQIGSADLGSPVVTVEGLFLDNDGDVLSFLNPLAPNGAELIVNTVGGGLLDAWVDFNGDGDFIDPEEQVLASAVVLDGQNIVNLFAPNTVAVLNNGTGHTWARFRLSSTGNQLPEGVVIGGEVEDYRVFVAAAALPEPVDDSGPDYTTDELPDSGSILSAPSIGANDDLSGLTGVTYELERDVTNGQLVLDTNTGEFTYTADDDFYGEDSFTYRLIGTRTVNGIDLPVRSSRAGTVTITVNPINDAPSAEPHMFVTTEPSDTNTDTAITITSIEMLTGAKPHPLEETLLPPWNEEEQDLKVIQISTLNQLGVLTPIIEQTSINITGDVSNFADEALFSLGTTDAPSQFVFEFDNDFSLAGGVLSANIRVDISTAVTDEDVRDAIFDAIVNDPLVTTTLAITPEKVGTTSIQLGGRNDLVVLHALPALTTSTDNTVLVDGNYFGDSYIDDGTGNFVPAGSVVVTVQLGEVLEVVYDPSADYNEFNPTDGGGPSLDHFVYTVSDDGMTTLPNGQLADPQPAPETVDATVFIQVRPQNDPPAANDDLITSATFGIPLQEDSNFVIPRSFLLGNDHAGQSPSDDESLGTNGNDGPVSLVTMQGLTQSFNLGPINSGIAVEDFAVGTGYIMWSEQDVFSRFPLAPPSNSLGATNSDHMVAVRFNGITWEYNNNVSWIPFLAMPTDRLLAEVDFDADTITSLQYAFGQVDGIEQGFVISDMVFEANTFNGLSKDGEFTITGTFFEISADPVFPTGFRPYPLTTAAGGSISLDINGNLVYTSAPDYFGIDSFEYFIVDQGIDVAVDGTVTTNVKYDVATVSLQVDPVNDTPGANDQGFITLEDTAITITAAELTAGSVGHANPVLPFPWNETNQDDPNTNIVELNVGGTIVTSANAGSGPFFTANGGRVTPRFDVNDFLVDLEYLPAQDFNADNPLDGGSRRLDSFGFTVADNGIAELPQGGTFANQPETASATAFVLVRPQNDAPVLGNDLITSTDPTWQSFSNAVPMEDTLLTIPSEFLLNNDVNAPATAADELNLINDSSTLQLVPISFVTDLGGTVTLLPNGDLTYLPPDDQFGLDTFQYAASDIGIDEDIFGNRQVNGLQSLGTVSILVEPVNDPPRSFDRFFTEQEDMPISFTANDLMFGAPGALPIDSEPVPAAPFDENEQSLRIVGFNDADESVDVSELTNGTGVLTMATVSNGTLTFNFSNGEFVDGTYQPGPDYNQRTPFATIELFNYIVADDGIVTVPGTGILNGTPGNDDTIDQDDARSQPATVTLSVTPVNDAPIFDFMSEVDVLERDDSGITVVGGWASNISPGPVTALDELQRETVSFTFEPALSTVPVGLFRQDPQIDFNGALSVFPNPDEIGTATIVVRVQDEDSLTPGFTPISTLVTFTLNVRPVNDPPRINPALAGTSDTASPDLAYSVAANGELTLTLPEDNTGSDGVTSSFLIPMRALGGGGFDPPGLLDLFEVGPQNEIDAELGGSQFLDLANFPSTTALGGSLVPITDNTGTVTALEYTPPQDYNNAIGTTDSFNYVVIDKSATGDETWSLFAGGLIPDPLTATNRVLLDLTPVNDRPVFEVATNELEIAEDSNLQRIGSFAFNFAAGPLGTATDETDPTNGQTAAFEVTPANFPQSQINDFFSTPPVITSGGVLEYQPAADAFGQFVFDIVLRDDGDSNVSRGDLNVSLPTALTINVRPINDAPVIDASAVGSLDMTTGEDVPLDIPAAGAGVAGDLLGAFNPGPANESSAIDPGGNQTLVIDSNFPLTTTEGGTLDPVTNGGGTITHYTYTPPADFVGLDSFVYRVVDDGETVPVGFNGQATPDPKSTVVTVTLDVTAINDPPVLQGGDNVTVAEDAGVVSISDWATGVQAGPQTAVDELVGPGAQQVSVSVAFVSGDTGLFASEPSASISGSNASLTFETAQDANGAAVYAATFTDNGPTNVGNGDNNTTIQTFTITVDAVNDAPTFTPGPDVAVPEDSGAYDQPWASDISPGPGEEATTQTIDRFEVVVPAGLEGLFSEAPAISTDGVLTFTPAIDASGQVDLQVTAIDSLGGRSIPVTLPLTIVESDDPPVANNDLLDTNEDNVLVIDVEDLLANDVDPDLLTNPGEFLTIILPPQSLSAQGALVIYDAANGEIRYDPRPAENLQELSPSEQLEDRFTYQLVDANGELTPPSADVVLTVQGINDAPMPMDDSPFVPMDGNAVLPVLDNDVDVDGVIVPSTIVITLQPTEGALTVDDEGVLTYVAKPGFEGTDIFRYTVADDLGQQSQQATVSVRVGIPPEANDDISGTFLNNPIFIEVLENDLGGLVDSSIVIETPPQNGTATPQADGTILYEPGLDFLGTDSFEYSVADIDGRRSENATVDLNVVESNLENPINAFDVNASGTVTSLDALLIINKLSQAGGASSIPVDPDARGPNFYDVNGDLQISSLDALLVINELAMQANNGGGEPEQIASTVEVGVNLNRNGSSLEPVSEVQPVSTIEEATDKVVGSAQIAPEVNDVIDAIVQETEEPANATDAVDAVLTDLL